MFVGQASTCTNVRIKGHLRYGGGQIKKRHRTYACVAITNEFNVSQTCCIGLKPIVLPTKNVIKDGKLKSNTILGSSICYNLKCPTCQNGTNTKNRDVEAAVCIALSGIITMLTGKPLPPFTKTSEFHTGNNQYRNQAVKDSRQVPVPREVPLGKFF
jgi:hypothetical protein